MKILPVWSDLHVLLQHTREILHPACLDQQVELDFQLNARRHHALVDPTRIQQVFWNLVRNAVKFTPPGGKITVTSRNDEQDRILISVHDTGIGIRAEMLPRIFEAFDQGDAAGQSRLGGLELMRTIQGQRSIPAVALSGYGMENDLQQCREASFRAHLLKPVRIDQLRQILSQLAAEAEN